MRKNEYRGKRTDGKGWVYGDLINHSEKEKIILEQNNGQWDILESGYKVIPETVGQLTGLEDKNGKKIYDGDVIEDYRGKLVVCYVQYTAMFCGVDCSKPSIDDSRGQGRTPYEIFLDNESCVEFDFVVGITGKPVVIGNIHDNPDLIERGIWIC